MQIRLKIVLLIAVAGSCGNGFAQIAPAAPAAPTSAASSPRVLGSLVKVDGQSLTLKDQQGQQTIVSLTSSTRLVQIAPGQTSLASATPIQQTELQLGDRLLVRVQPAANSSTLVATIVVVMKQADIAQKHASTLTSWQQGVGGTVKSVDASSKSIVIAAGGARTITIHLAATSIVKRYAAESVQYEAAQPSSLDKIMVGDQLRARGSAGADAAAFQAEEVIAGSFRNLSGKISSVDASAGVVTFTDLATKQPVQLKVTSDSQVRKLDDATAEKLAAGMKSSGESGGGRGPGSAGGPTSAPAGGSVPANDHPHTGGAGYTGHGAGTGPSGSGSEPSGSSGSGSEMQQALAHAPAIQLAALKKGDFVMVVASAGEGAQMGAITIVDNVEPLLRASPNASAAGLSSWSLGGGAPAQAQ